jgi:pimeloyl-ACP methyl ester carboxylesterase
VIDRFDVTTLDRRRLAVEVIGAPDGAPVFLMHGTPGSKNGPKPRNIVLYRLGVRLICYDRPGYGGSDRFIGRTVADAATDVETIADFLGIEQFGVVGRSGGGPHALACAAILQNRVTRTSVLVGLAPPAPATRDFDWHKGMTQVNIETHTAELNELEIQLEALAVEARRDPETMVQYLLPHMSPHDERVVHDVAMRRLLHANYKEALYAGPEGWIDDTLAFSKPWGFDLSAIKTPVRLWHGQDDTFSPVSHTRWLQDHLVDAELEVDVEAGVAHFGAMEALPKILTWLIAPVDATSQPRLARVRAAKQGQTEP